MSIVALSHEIGSGGPEIGQKVAERLGLHYVDQEIISEAVQHLVGSADEVSGEQILAVVRPLRQQRETANGRLVPIHDERVRQDA